MDAVLNHPANAGLVRSLCRSTGAAVSVVAADAVGDPYSCCGSHPEIVERVWDKLGYGLPPASRRILCGTPVLVAPHTGVVLAVCYGTSYCIRIPEGVMTAALGAGCETSHRWPDGHVTDLAEEFGAGWLFGGWDKREAEWCGAAAAAFEGHASPRATPTDPPMQRLC